MSATEVNYAQIEKGMLSIVFAAEKVHQYVFRKEAIIVESDHKPIESIIYSDYGLSVRRQRPRSLTDI